MAMASLSQSAISNVSGLNISIKRQILAEWIKKTVSNNMLSTRDIHYNIG
jgi:hypothetical protein